MYVDDMMLLSENREEMSSILERLEGYLEKKFGVEHRKNEDNGV